MSNSGLYGSGGSNPNVSSTNTTGLYGNGTTTTPGNTSSSNTTSLYSPTGNLFPNTTGGDIVITGNLAVNGGNITTIATTATLFNTNATTLGIGGAATNLTLGAGSGTTYINNVLHVPNGIVADLTGNVTGNVTGTVSSLANHTTDDLAEGSTNLYFTTARARNSISGGTGISYNASTGVITNTGVGTTYSMNASTTTGGANLNLAGSDSTTSTVKFASGTGITVAQSTSGIITITNTDPGSANVTSITGTANQIIASASTGAVTLSTPQDIATTSSPTFANLITSGGHYAQGAFSGSYSDGIIMDYVTGLGRITVGSNDGLTIYSGGLTRLPMVAITSNGFTTISNNLQVNGGILKNSSGVNTLTLESQGNVTVGGQYINVNNNQVGTPSKDFSLNVKRGGAPNVAMRWRESAAKWQFSNDGTTFYDMDQYSLAATTTTGGANLTLTGVVDGNVGTVEFAGSGGSTVSYSGGVITINSTDTNTTYTYTASSATGGANLTLTGSDATTNTVKVTSGTGVTVSDTSSTEINIAIGQDVSTSATPTFANLITTGGVYAKGAYSGSYTDGIVVDYATGNGRISVGSADGITLYGGGVANTALLAVDQYGVTTTKLVDGTRLHGSIVATFNDSYTPPGDNSNESGINGFEIISSAGGQLGYGAQVSMRSFQNDATTNPTFTFAHANGSGNTTSYVTTGAAVTTGSFTLTGSIANGVLTVTATSGTLIPGQQITNTSGSAPIPSTATNIYIQSQLTGTPGSTGTYQIASYFTYSLMTESGSMTASATTTINFTNPQPNAIPFVAGVAVAISGVSGNKTVSYVTPTSVTFPVTFSGYSAGATITNLNPGGLASGNNFNLGSFNFNSYATNNWTNIAAKPANGGGGSFPVQFQVRAIGTHANGNVVTNITGATWAAGVATVTFATQNLPPYLSQTVVTIAGVTSSGSGSYNGSFTLLTATSNSITYLTAVNPGTYTSGGTITQNQITNGAASLRIRGYNQNDRFNGSTQFDLVSFSSAGTTMKSTSYTFSDNVITGSLLTSVNFLTLNSTKAQFTMPVQLMNYTATALRAITGAVGYVAVVSDNGGKMAYWDLTNTRWSYVFDNSAV